MDNLGTIIYDLRKKNNMSAQELAQGICSNKYIYMIENSERIPSVEILNKLFLKLNFDYFDCLQYAHMDNSMEIAELVRRINRLRNLDQYDEVHHLLPKLREMDNGCLEQFIDYNEATYYSAVLRDNKKALEYINRVLSKRDLGEFNYKHLDEYNLNEIRAYNLRASIFYWEGNKEYGFNITAEIYKYFREHTKISTFTQLIVTNAIAYTAMLLDCNRCMEASVVLKEITSRQDSEQTKYKFHHMHYYLAKINVCEGNYEKAREMAVVAKHHADKTGDARMMACIDELMCEIDIKSQTGEKINYHIIYEKQLMDDETIAGKIQVYQPNIVIVTLNRLSNKVFKDMITTINHDVMKCLGNWSEIHMVYDVRDIVMSEMINDMGLRELLLRDNTALKVNRKTIIRLQNDLSINNQMIEMYFSILEESFHKEKVVLKAKLKSLNEAMKIIALYS